MVLGLDMPRQLIRSGFSDRSSNPIRADVECCKSRYHFVYWVMDCSSSRILSSSITGGRPGPTGGLVGSGVSYLFAKMQVAYSASPADMVAIYFGRNNYIHRIKSNKLLPIEWRPLTDFRF